MWVVKLDVCSANPPEEAGAVCVPEQMQQLHLGLSPSASLSPQARSCGGTEGIVSGGAAAQPLADTCASCLKELLLERGCRTEQVREYQMQWLGME